MQSTFRKWLLTKNIFVGFGNSHFVFKEINIDHLDLCIQLQRTTTLSVIFNQGAAAARQPPVSLREINLLQFKKSAGSLNLTKQANPSFQNKFQSIQTSNCQLPSTGLVISYFIHLDFCKALDSLNPYMKSNRIFVCLSY